MGRCSKHRWRKKLLKPIRRIGGKNSIKWHLLVNGRGVPLSLVVTEANAHDIAQIGAVIQAIVVNRYSG